MPTMPRLGLLWIVILLGCACEGGKSSSHTKFAKSCANGCERGGSAPGSRSGVSRGGVADRAAGGDRDDAEESGPAFDEPFTGIAGSGGIFGGIAGAAAGSGAGFAGGFAPPAGGAGAGSFPVGGFGPTAGFDAR